MKYKLVSAIDLKTVMVGTHDECYNTQHLLWDFNIYTHIMGA